MCVSIYILVSRTLCREKTVPKEEVAPLDQPEDQDLPDHLDDRVIKDLREHLAHRATLESLASLEYPVPKATRDRLVLPVMQVCLDQLDQKDPVVERDLSDPMGSQ